MKLWFLSAPVLAASWMVVVLALIVALGLGVHERSIAATREEYKDLIRRFSGNFATRISVEDVARDLLSFILRLSMTEKTREKVELRLSMAGFTGARPLFLFQVIKVSGLAVGLVISALAVPTEIMSWAFALVMVVLFFFGPDIWLSRQISTRTKKIGWQLPEALDLLQLCVRAGLGFTSGLQEVSRVQRGAVAAEFSRVLQEMQFGLSRIDAFTALAERTKQPDLVRFAHAMVRADQAGITVSDMLAEQARSMRESRHTLAREKAQQVSVKILFPLLVCFLPGVFLIVLGPAVLNAMATFSGK
ncbi:MAG: type II secretion system F family protein [Candidatus Nanopelagicales bacterium]